MDLRIRHPGYVCATYIQLSSPSFSQSVILEVYAGVEIPLEFSYTN